MSLPIKRTDLSRSTRFAFSCSRCLSCCRNKKIQVNPYEIARLAMGRGMSTAEFTARHTTAGGTVLAWNEDGTCVFLGDEGCGVHADRPLVCRLYPLGRHVKGSGEESFSEVEPEPSCKGAYGEDGCIADYLVSQGALPFMEAADRYLSLFWKLYLVVHDKALEPGNREAVVDVFQRAKEIVSKGSALLTDMDAVVEAYCREASLPVPQDAEEKMSLHITALERWAESMRRE